MNDTLVSVIVPVYNVEKYLVECLESILHQTYSLWECVLVDDGSTDSSGDICDEYSTKDQRFKVIHKENGGISSARNCSMKYIRGGYITFVDSDDCLDRFFLEKGMRCAEESKSDVIQLSSTRDVTLLGANLNSKFVCLNADQVRKDTLQFQNVTSTVWGKLYRTEIINGFRFNESCYVLEDVEFLTRMMQNCTFTVSEYVGYYYRITLGSLITQGLSTRKLVGSIACQNSCIQLLKETDMEDRAYQFKYESLFNWLIRTVNQDNWRELYQIIQNQILHDKKHIIRSNEISLKVKTVLYACSISTLFAYSICKIRR